MSGLVRKIPLTKGMYALVDSTGYRGIEIIYKNTYRVRLYKGKTIHIGCYKDIKEAIKARNEAYLKCFNFDFSR